MIKVNVVTQPQAFAAGTVAGKLRFLLACAALGYSQSQDVDGNEADFSDAISPGDYTATVERLDASGNVLGSAVSGTLTISPDDHVSVDVPASITLSLV